MCQIDPTNDLCSKLTDSLVSLSTELLTCVDAMIVVWFEIQKTMIAQWSSGGGKIVYLKNAYAMLCDIRNESFLFVSVVSVEIYRRTFCFSGFSWSVVMFLMFLFFFYFSALLMHTQPISISLRHFNWSILFQKLSTNHSTCIKWILIGLCLMSLLQQCSFMFLRDMNTSRTHSALHTNTARLFETHMYAFVEIIPTLASSAMLSAIQCYCWRCCTEQLCGFFCIQVFSINEYYTHARTICTAIDSELDTLGTQVCVHLYSILPISRLCTLYVGVCYIKQNKKLILLHFHFQWIFASDYAALQHRCELMSITAMLYSSRSYKSKMPFLWQRWIWLY